MRIIISVALLPGLLALAAAVSGCDSSPSTSSSPPTAPVRQAAGLSAAEKRPVEPGAASAASGQPAAAVTTPAAPRPKLLPGARTRVLSAAGDRDFDRTFDDLRFEMQIGEPFRRELLTDAIMALDGKPIRIRGFILPTAQKRGLKQFVLVRDNQECCFGPGAALFDCILVEMLPGKTAEFSIRPVAVSGTFHVREFQGPDGVHLAVYQIDGEEVK
jgi:hypothetical protein